MQAGSGDNGTICVAAVAADIFSALTPIGTQGQCPGSSALAVPLLGTEGDAT